MEKKAKEPLIHLVKRDAIPWYKSWAIRGAAIIAGLLLCALVTTIATGENPVSVYQTMLSGAFGSSRKAWITFQNLSILLIISLALSPAFKMKFWNIGAEGQILMGGLASAACMICLRDILPNWAVMVCMVLSSILAGAIWGVIPAVFKALWKTNETLSTLMMNYIALQLVAYFIIVWEVPKGSGNIGIINQESHIGWLPDVIHDNRYALPIIVAVLITGFIYVYQRYSKHGYEISVVGESENTARYIGINVEKVIIRTMALSGAICGIAGLLLVGKINHTITTTITNSQGFTAVMIPWLSKFNPIAMIFTSGLIIVLQRGASEISTVFGFNSSFGDILTGIILFFIIGAEFFINYKINFRKKSDNKGKEAAF